ncbi:FHA domain-containing protein [Candidatus Sumerlaeota bacterium]|nr:FHA domain-containing protein [Candidatus Sumerlaeota bacterium]
MGQKAKIIVSAEGRPETVMELNDRLTVGRSTSNDLVLDDQNASRRHAEIRHLGGVRYRVSDIGSANGTWLNGRRLTTPKDLEDGDQIVIGNIMLRFIAPEAQASDDPNMTTGSVTTGAGMFATALAMRNEMVVVFVADIRNYTSMSEVLPTREFSRLIADWFREISEIIENHGGTIDKFIGDAVMAYWVAKDPKNPGGEVNAALRTAKDMIDRADVFSKRLSGQFPGHAFQIGIGLNMGDAIFGNVGTGEIQSFTVVGDSVNVAFRLESLSKEKGCVVIASRGVTECALPEFRFRDLGLAEVKGRKEPVSIWTLLMDTETNPA